MSQTVPVTTNFYHNLLISNILTTGRDFVSNAVFHFSPPFPLPSDKVHISQIFLQE